MPRLEANLEDEQSGPSPSEKSASDQELTINEIAKKFNLVATYDTLEGHQKLSK
jgi:hypothetical protein